MTFLTPIFQSLLASIVYGIGSALGNVFCEQTAFSKRYKRAFEKAICRFYSDSEIAGNEARGNYNEYLSMLQDASKQEDILSSNNQVYEKLLDFFAQEVSKDRFLQAYTNIRGYIITQKSLAKISSQLNDAIKLGRENREQSQNEHQKIANQIDDLKDLITNPQLLKITLAPINSKKIARYESLGQHIVLREALVNKCATLLEEGKLLVLYGALKIGKTTLAQLIARKLPDIQIIDGVPASDLEATIISVLSLNPKSRCIITSEAALSENLSTIDFSMISQIEVSLLSLAETLELISTYEPSNDLSHFIYAHTSGHPVLVKTLCSYLSSCGWVLREDNFDAVLSYSFDHNVIRTLSDLMGNIIPESETRILLNRLLLVNGSFTEKEVILLADVTPAIMEPRRRLLTLIPTWVSIDSGHYRVSPLLIKLWKADIPIESQIKCNKLLAQNILDKDSPLNEHDVLSYINYSVRAKEFDDAGHMYIMVLNKLHDAGETLPDNSVLRSIWIDLPLPLEMSLKVRIGFRIAQLLLLGRVSKEKRQYLLWDLKQQVESYEGEDYKAFFYSAVVLLCWQESDVEDGLKFYNVYRSLDKKETTVAIPQIGERIKEFDNNIWFFLLRLTTVRDFEEWLVAFKDAQVEYSHSDIQICESCYLSITRFIMVHMKERDFEEKKAMLNHIFNKAELNGCPEIAIVCLFKLIDLLAVNEKYREAQTIYDTHYEKYRDFSLARILLNGAMANASYRSQSSTKEDLRYFENVMAASDKELIPNIQLHIMELYSYVVSDSDPKQSVLVLEEALAYSKDEKHRVDIFEYYQCKGELSYAYWLVGDRDKATKLLSECVESVLPLAEADKVFAKTYLCLCNCLLTKYSLEVQNKPLPEGQASPQRGMFTENDLMGLDELYSVDRLYVTCYQMSDLCDNLKEKSLAYEWAKKAVQYCRKREAVVETHYLLFLLIPLLSADQDLDDLAFIIRHSDKARRVSYGIHPNLRQGNKDSEFIEYQITPLLMEALVLKMRGINDGLEVVKGIIKDYEAIADDGMIQLVKDVFERDSFDRNLISEVNKLSVQEKYGVYICAYLMTALYSDNDYAFDLLISLLPELLKQLVQIYGQRIMTLVNRFVSAFWKARILRSPQSFSNYAHLKERGVKIIDEYEGKPNQASKTMLVISHHLKHSHNTNIIQEDWLYS